MRALSSRSHEAMSIESALQRVSAIDRVLANPASLVQGALPRGIVATTGGVAAPPATEVTSGATEVTSGATAQVRANAGSFAAALQLASGAQVPSIPPSTLSATPESAALSTGLPASGVYQPYGAASTYGAAPTYGAGSTYGIAPSNYGESNPGARIVAAAESQIGQTEQPPGSNESPAIAMYRSATVGAIPGAPWCAYFASWAARQAGEPIGLHGEGQGAVAGIWSWAQSVGRAVPNGPGVVPAPGDLIVFGDQHVGIVRDVLPNGSIQTIEGNYENKVAANVRTPTEATGYVNMG